MNNQKKDVSKYFHDTLTLMKNYRDALWNVEVAERNLHAEFHAAYGASNRASFDDLALPNPHLEGYAQSISRSKKMLSVIDSSVNLMREKHKKGSSTIGFSIIHIFLHSAMKTLMRFCTP